MKFFGYSLFALFWNGILSALLWNIGKGIQRGTSDWALIMFMLPFGAVGLGAIFGMGDAFLGLFNPRVRLAMDRESAELGSELELSWSFRGRVGRIRRLTITLEGMERAIFRSGAGTRTDEALFLDLPLVNVTAADEIANGRVRFQIPRDLMHSFKTRGSEIVWRLRVEGEVRRFPDINDEFLIWVLPRRGGT